jgi:ABC-type multidrug transport system ATPase subunit
MDFTPVTLAFRDVWYSIKIGSHDVDLLQSVSGYFEPGSVTALMGTTGAGRNLCLCLCRLEF